MHVSMSVLFINWFCIHTSKTHARSICTFQRCKRSSSQIFTSNSYLKYFATQKFRNATTCKFVVGFALASQASHVCFSQVTDYKQVK